jgi:hypothetical protein
MGTLCLHDMHNVAYATPQTWHLWKQRFRSSVSHVYCDIVKELVKTKKLHFCRCKGG